MASGKVSKNSRTSKSKEVVRPQKIKNKKPTILIELTKEVYNKYKQGQDLTLYDDGKVKRQVVGITCKFGKQYLQCINE